MRESALKRAPLELRCQEVMLTSPDNALKIFGVFYMP